jgi:hypothetical protein
MVFALTRKPSIADEIEEINFVLAFHASNEIQEKKGELQTFPCAWNCAPQPPTGPGRVGYESDRDDGSTRHVRPRCFSPEDSHSHNRRRGSALLRGGQKNSESPIQPSAPKNVVAYSQDSRPGPPRKFDGSGLSASLSERLPRRAAAPEIHHDRPTSILPTRCFQADRLKSKSSACSFQGRHTAADIHRLQNLANLVAKRSTHLQGAIAKPARQLPPASLGGLFAPRADEEAAIPSISRQLNEIARIEALARASSRSPQPGRAGTACSSNVSSEASSVPATVAPRPRRCHCQAQPEAESPVFRPRPKPEDLGGGLGAAAPCAAAAAVVGAERSEPASEEAALRPSQPTRVRFPDDKTGDVSGPPAAPGVPGAGRRRLSLARGSFAWAGSWVERLPKGGKPKAHAAPGPARRAGRCECLLAVARAVRRGMMGEAAV